jgi:hypothetical protein
MSPAHNARLTKSTTIRAEAWDNVGVIYVDFLVDGQAIARDSAAPFEYSWNIGFWADGNYHALAAKACDQSGNVGLSEVISVLISPYAVVFPVQKFPLSGAVYDSTNRVLLAWNSAGMDFTYNLQISNFSNFQSAVLDTVLADTVYRTSALNDGTYYWRVREINNLNLTSAWSSVWRFTIKEPAGPILVSPSEGEFLDSTIIGLVWRRLAGAIAYSVEVSKDLAFSELSFARVSQDTSVSANLPEKTLYYWRVRALKDDGAVSGWSPVSNFASAVDLTSGLIAHYPFNGNANNASGNGYHGSVVGATLANDRFGKANSAYMFNGTSDYIRIAATVTNPNLPFSWSAWVFLPRLPGLGETGAVIEQGGDPGKTLVSPKIWVDSNAKVHFYLWVSPSNHLDLVSNSPLTLNAWHHLLCVYTTQRASIYINARLDREFNYRGGSPVLSNFYVGANPPYYVEYFNGCIDDVRIYDRALVPAEIQALYHEAGWNP